MLLLLLLLPWLSSLHTLRPAPIPTNGSRARRRLFSHRTMPSADADAEPALLLRRPKTSANPWQPCRKCGMSYVQIPREHCDDCERMARQQSKLPEILVNGRKPSQDLTAPPAPTPPSQHRPRLRKRVAPDGGGLHPSHASKASRSHKGAGPAPCRARNPSAGKEEPEAHRSVYELGTDGAQHEEEMAAASPRAKSEEQFEADHENEPRHVHEPRHEDEQETGHADHVHAEARHNSTLQPTTNRIRGPRLSPAAKEWRAKVRPLLGAAAGPSPIPSPMPSPPLTPHAPDGATTDATANPVSPPQGSASPMRAGGRGGSSFAQRVVAEVGVPSLERQRVLEQELCKARADNRRLRDLVRGMTVRTEALDRLLDLDVGDDARAALFDEDNGSSPLLRRVYPGLCRRCRGVVQGHVLR